jgi:DNA polymerase V
VPPTYVPGSTWRRAFVMPSVVCIHGQALTDAATHFAATCEIAPRSLEIGRRVVHAIEQKFLGVEVYTMTRRSNVSRSSSDQSGVEPSVVGQPKGFISPVMDAAEVSLDLHTLLVRHPAATFFLRMEGDAMHGASLHSGDLLVVDRSLRPLRNRLVVAVVDDEFLVRRYLPYASGNGCALVAAHPNVAPIHVRGEDCAVIWGVVTYVIHRASACCTSSIPRQQ